MKISKGKNIVMMDKYKHSELNKCLNVLKTNITEIPGKCKQLVVNNLIPKFLALHLKTSEAEVKSELIIHNQDNPYMDIGLTFNYDSTKFTYWWGMIELCPSDVSSIYLKKMPYSSCTDNENKSTSDTNIMYNIYVFSDRYSSTLQYLDDKGIIGLYTIIVVYFGYKLAFDIFRSFKFKLGYTETPYPDRILQLCYEIYLVRSFEEYEMEEDLYAMLIFLFRSPETLIRYTRKPNNMILE
uniref:Piezo-type mechanosensitive ion channel component 2 n=1 Tax=Sipha flava TaxID=143950 RepID=A0A2S2R7M0_9HEMI